MAVPSVSGGLPPVSDIGVDGLPRRLRRALGEVLVEVSGTGSAGLEPAVALRTYGDGCVVLAVAGAFDQAGVERLRDLMHDVNRFATTELVVELSLLTRCEPALARALAALRMQRLVAGARVELHDPPPELTRRLGPAPAQAFELVVTPE